MRIAWFSHTAETNGAEISMLEACKGLNQAGHQVTVFVPGDGPLGPRLQACGAKVISTPYLLWTCPAVNGPSLVQRSRRAASNFLSGRRLQNILRHIKPDVAVTNTITMPSGALAARWARIPHVWYIHEFGEEDHGFGYHFGTGFSFRYIDWLSDRVIVNSNAVLKKFNRLLSEEKLRRVYYAVEVPEMPPREEQATREAGSLNLIQVGRIVEGKRPEDAIRAVGILVRKGLDVTLTFLGTVPLGYKLLLDQWITEEGLADKVLFVPYAENPLEFIKQADVLLMCSRNEAFGRVTVEAMKLGLPVVGARSGGTAELISDGWNGFLYEPGNQRELAESIEKLCNDRALLPRMGNNAQTWSKSEFTIENYVGNLVSVFEEAINSRKQ